MYPVAESFDEVSSPVFLVERAAASLLGVLEYGVHVNGLIKEENGDTKMWMARRSKTKSKFPGLWDHIVAGGQPAGLSLMDNVIKECLEEAGIPPELTLKGVKPAGAISYASYGGKLKNEGEGVMNRVVLFCFDLELPNDFVPHANDGEVESFFKWNLDEIAKSMDPECNDPIKPNCYLVIIDWLMRTGAISPDSSRYLEILRTLRSGTCN
jgi:8-oxo-dGTP pyrophosphatase MutT (NUDIX family)